MLNIKGLSTSYGSIKAIKGIDIDVPEGSIVSLIGANGAGKTTTMKSLVGLLKPQAGQIKFQGQEIQGFAPHRIVNLGMSLVPEGRNILSGMTVLENLEMGAYQRKDKEVQADLLKVIQRFPILEERKQQLGGTLSGGQQQMLAIARALMARPKLLLLDEPSMGLAPLVVADIFKVIQEINQEGTTILLVEQNVRQALKIAHYAYVLETGKIVLHGDAKDVANNPRVMEAYLGGAQAGTGLAVEKS
jgi:branched-chain amino acid transport system ATP-binding protein